MKREIKPSWSKKQQTAGEQMHQAWEAFFAAAEKGENAPAKPLLGHAKEEKIAAIQARNESGLLRYPNVVGVATGIRTKGGKPTGEPCLVVYVERKIPRSNLRKNEILPSKIEGIPVDVVEAGKVEPLRV